MVRGGKKMNSLTLSEMVTGKRVLFITTKNVDYIRNSQEIRILKDRASRVKVIGSGAKGYAKRLLFVYRELMKEKAENWDCAFVGFAPQLVLPLFHRKLKKIPVIEDFFISLWDTLVDDRKKFKPGGLISRRLKKWDEKTLRYGDLIICDTRAHGNFFCEELGCDPEKLEVLYLEADISIYYPRERKKKEPEERKRVLYFGSILPLQGIDVIMGALQGFTREDGLDFEIIGPVPTELRRENDFTTYYEWLPQEELAEHIAEADLCLAGHFSADIQKARRTIPGKAYIYEAMGKPMILGDNPANRERYLREGVGGNGDSGSSRNGSGIWFVEMGNPKALEEVIRKAAAEIG